MKPFYLTILMVNETPNSHTIRMIPILTPSKAEVNDAVRKIIDKRGIDTSSPKSLEDLGQYSSLQECEQAKKEFYDMVKYKAEQKGFPISIE